MPRKKEPGPPGDPVVIHPDTVFTLEQLRLTLRLPKNTLPWEIKRGRLACSKRANRYWFLGAWVLDWIRAGRRRPRGQAEATAA